MLEIPVLRWGQPYESLEKQDVVAFETGEALAQIHQANGGLVKMDLRKASKARDALRQLSIDEILKLFKKVADLYMNADLPVGNGTQSPQDFCRIQSASTGLPENMCAFNMRKLSFVLEHMDDILDALTRGLPHEILSRGYGRESGRDVMVSYQANSPVLGAVLPNNSPGVHTLWLPALAMQIGLALKPGSAEPWTPYRVIHAFIEAGLPKEAVSLYPGPHEVGGALMSDCRRVMIFGSQQTVEQHAGNRNVSVHGPGFSKIVIGDDIVDQWEQHLDLICNSIFANSGRSCINASGVWVSRHGKEIAEAVAERLGPIEPKPMSDPSASLAAFTTPAVAEAMHNQIEEQLQGAGVTEVTAKYRNGDRLIQHERYAFLRPTIVYCESPEAPLANTEYMFPFASVVECPQEQMIQKMGTMLVCTAITEDPAFSQQLLDAVTIDRLNIGPIPTMALNWLQPHEGNIVDFLFRARAFQNSPPPAN